MEPEVRKTEGTVYRMDSEARYWVKSRQWTVELVKLVNGIQVLVNQNKFEDPKKGRLISNLNHLKYKVVHSKPYAAVGSYVLEDLFDGTLPLHWRQLVAGIYRTAEWQTGRVRRAGLGRWSQWARQVMHENGAGLAHRYTKAMHY